MTIEVRRVWSELVPHGDLLDPALLRALARRSIRLMVAVEPTDLDTIPSVLRAAATHGVTTGIWPLVDDEHGRFLNLTSAERFGAHVVTVLDTLEGAGLRPAEVALDLEPHIANLRSALRLRPDGLLRHARRAPRTGVLHAVVEAIRSRGIPTFAAVAPMVLWDRKGHDSGWQRLLATPVDELDLGRVNVMLYTSLVTGYSRVARRSDARWLLHRLCRDTAEIFGARASVSVGVTGVGALGDEAAYSDELELADDVAIARAAGIRDIALHGLFGAVGSGRLDRWLDALCDTPPASAPPPATRRADAVLAAGRWASRPLRWLARS